MEAHQFILNELYLIRQIGYFLLNTTFYRLKMFNHHVMKWIGIYIVAFTVRDLLVSPEIRLVQCAACSADARLVRLACRRRYIVSNYNNYVMFSSETRTAVISAR